jgi:ectoine hydroxylase-related dioxygenase (phytanoyl-CoA dioxygenase family)
MTQHTMTSKAYGITERAVSPDEMALHVERIRVRGYTVVQSGFGGAEVEEFGARLDAVLATQVEEFGAERLQSIGEALTARCPLVYDELFLSLAAHASVLQLVSRLLGDYVVLMQQNGVVNAPRQAHTQLAYHRDLPYQHFTSSRPLAVSALFCIDPFRPETGATTVLPGSHRVDTFPSEPLAAELETAVTAEPGSFIVFDSMLFHRAGANRSEHVRRAVNHVYTIPLIAQQISLPSALDGKYSDNPSLARLLGYDNAPARSVTAWRERRAARSR